MHPSTYRGILIIAVPFALFLYPAIALLSSRSEIPILLGRYSRDLLALNLLIIVAYAGFVLAIWSRRRGLQFAAVLLLSLLTLVAGNNAVRGLPGLEATTQLVRLTGGLALVVLTYLADREGRPFWSGIGLGLGAVVFVTALIDVSFSFTDRLLSSDKQSQIHGKYRTTMDVSNVSEADIVLVGDSFVWGAGVPLEQRFGDVLQRKLGGAQGPRVYSLGVVGAGLGEYNRQLLDVAAGTRARNVVILFYANDMPPRANLRVSLEQASVAIEQRSISGRALVDLLRFAVTPTPQAYAREQLGNFAMNDATFALRWRMLQEALKTLHQSAKERSRARPILVVLPMLVNADVASFDEPHGRVVQLAEQIGFCAVDSTHAFRARGDKLERFRAAKNDLHLNEAGNAIVADILQALVTGASGTDLPELRPGGC